MSNRNPIADSRTAGVGPNGEAKPDPHAVGVAVMAEQVRMLYRAPVAMLVNLLNAPIVAAVVWSDYPKWLLVAWLAAFGTLIPIRAALWRAYARGPQAPDTARIWARHFVIGTGLTGCLWGLAGSVVFVSPHEIYRVFVAFVLAGMSAGAVASNSVYFPALLAFMIPTLAPATVSFFIQGDLVSLGMGVLAVIFGSALTLIGYNLNRSLAESFRLRIENAGLVRNLTIARDAAEAVSEAKSRFLAHMSHELRTPLNAIIGFSGMFTAELLGKLPNADYVAYGRFIQEGAQHLLAMIEEILDFSRMQTRATTLEESVIELRPVIEACLRGFDDRARDRGIQIDASIPASLPRIRADEAKLRRILAGLLSNAVKFTLPGGRVHVSASLEPDGAIALAVSDTGIGMSEADIPKAISPFRQLDDSFARKHAGIGLGLPLAKALAEIHGGALRIESELGRGTRAIVHFPPQRTVAAAEPSARALDNRKDAELARAG